MNFSGCSIIMHSTSLSSVAMTSPKYSYPYIRLKNWLTYCIFKKITISKDITSLDSGNEILILRVNNVALAFKNDGNRCLRWIFELFLCSFGSVSEVSPGTATHGNIILFLRSASATSLITHDIVSRQCFRLLISRWWFPLRTILE